MCVTEFVSGRAETQANPWIRRGFCTARHVLGRVQRGRMTSSTAWHGMCAVERRDDARVIGFCGLVHPDDQPEAELKYALRRDHWGRGLGSEVATAMLAHGLRAHGLTHVIATVHPGNTASRRVLGKIGMTHERTLHDEDGDVELYAWRAPG